MATDTAGSRWLQLPSSVLLTCLAFSFANLVNGTPAPTPTANITRKPPMIATTGSGPEYASACWTAVMNYDASSSSWTSAHEWISNTTQLLGGTSVSEVTYYENATTLCDGHARVTYSPAISLSTGTITYPGTVTSTSTIVGTYFSNLPFSAPSCSINPSDCDGLWKAYSTSMRANDPPLETPPCMGRSAASSWASVTKDIYGCGECTIYGEGVELVYFPTYPSSRDMCASTPTATLTSYGPGAVITAYAGKSYSGQGDAGGKKTAVADGHTFTSGTAYISISTVYAVDRCSKTFGTPIMDAILAMPSESVLSLRYSQDHFQRLMSTDQVTGYPVSYADFNTPIPWSAWNGQNQCDPGGLGGWACSIIYEPSYRPQLAIPPEITQLSPEFENCQMWYNGLWDPPLALTEAASEAQPTPPGGFPTTTDSAAPSLAPAAPTTTPTALPSEFSTSSGGSDGSTSLPAAGPTLPANGPTTPNNTPSLPANGPTLPATPPLACISANEPWMQSFHIGGKTYMAEAAQRRCEIDGVTITAGGPTETLAGGVQASYGNDGLILKGYSTVGFQHSPSQAVDGSQSAGGLEATDSVQTDYVQSSGGPAHTDSVQTTCGPASDTGLDTVVVTVEGGKVTVVQTSNGGPVVVGTSMTLAPGGTAATLSNGEILSAATGGLVVGWTGTVGKEDTAGTAQSSAPSASDISRNSAGSQASSSSTDQSSGTSSSGLASSMGPASAMSPAQALSLFAAVFAMVLIGG